MHSKIFGGQLDKHCSIVFREVVYTNLVKNRWFENSKSVYKSTAKVQLDTRKLRLRIEIVIDTNDEKILRIGKEEE